MNKSKIWLSTPHMGGDELKFINNAFEQNWIAPVGPSVLGFEEDLSHYLKATDDFDIYTAVLSSGTAALHLAMVILNVGPNDVVVVQSFTFCASANPVIYQGAEIVFVDSEMDTWNMDPVQLELAIHDLLKKGYGIENQVEPQNGKGYIRAIVPVHLYGMPAKMNELSTIANKFNIPIIEDAAESLGSTYMNQSCGTFGEMSILSFNGNKIITTSSGGALVSKTNAYIEKARFLSTQARDNELFYQHSTIGYNYRMSNILASIGQGQLKVIDERVQQRRANNQRYREFFQNIDYVQLHTEPSIDFYSNYWLTAIYLDENIPEGLTIERIQEELIQENIESRHLWKPMHMQPIFSNKLFYGTGVSEKLFRSGLCLPSGSNLTEMDFDRIFTVLKKLFKK